MTLTAATTRILEVPGATLTYDVRPGGADAPPLFLIGSPMAAAGLGTAVAESLGQETVIFPSDHGGFLGGEYGQTGSRTRSRPSCAKSSRRADRCS